jgi:hypothetical protein
MAGRILRVVFGFVLASLAAGLALVLFVNTPSEMPTWPVERYTETGRWALAVGTHVAVFSSAFAFIGTVYAEWRGINSATYSVFVGLTIALLGFAAHYAGEGSGAELSTYALSAFIVTGFVGGMVYWLVSGRYAGGRGQSSKPDAGAPLPVEKGPARSAKA